MKNQKRSTAGPKPGSSPHSIKMPALGYVRLSRATGISEARLRRMAAGTCDPPLHDVLSLAREAGIGIGSLLRTEGPSC